MESLRNSCIAADIKTLKQNKHTGLKTSQSPVRFFDRRAQVTKLSVQDCRAVRDKLALWPDNMRPIKASINGC